MHADRAVLMNSGKKKTVWVNKVYATHSEITEKKNSSKMSTLSIPMNEPLFS
jgi:hypothetical protein